jgi:hypothetical protein
MNVWLKAAKTFLYFHTPTRIRVHLVLSIALPMGEKGCPVAHLCDGRMRAKIPHHGCQHIPAGSKKWSEIVSFVSPVGEITAARTVAHSLLIYIKDELVIGAHVYIEVLRRFGDFDDLSKVEHNFVSLRSIRSRDPLRLPESGLMIRQTLCPSGRDVGGNGDEEDEDEEDHSLFAHARDGTSAGKAAESRMCRFPATNRFKGQGLSLITHIEDYERV